MSVRILTTVDLVDLLPPSALIVAAERAACAAQSGDVVAPPRSHLSWQTNTLLTMPAVAEGLVGVKLVSIAPGNAARGLPLVQGVMILSDAETGRPLAIIDAASLTAMRTGAVGAAGVKYTTGTEVDTIGVVGCGMQGAWQAISICSVRPVREVFCFNRSDQVVATFSERLKKSVPEVRVTPCQTVSELLERTDVVITATSSSQPVLPNSRAQLEGKHFVSIGSFKPFMQELPDAVYELAGQLVIDAEAARHEVGDVLNPVEKNLVKSTDVFCLGELIRGERSVDISRTTVFKSVGMALYDLYVARALFARAQQCNVGQKVDL